MPIYLKINKAEKKKKFNSSEERHSSSTFTEIYINKKKSISNEINCLSHSK